MTWKVDVGPVSTDQPMSAFLQVLQAQEVWRLLTKPQQAALVAAYPDGVVGAHANTLRALTAHGMTADGKLTAAAKLVVYMRPVKP